MRRSSGSQAAGAVAGSTVAALVVGLSEAAVVSAERQLGLDANLMFFAVLFYGLSGVAAGAAIAIGMAIIGRARRRELGGSVAYATSGAATFAALATVIARFRIFRDVFNETFDGQAITPLMFQIASLVVALTLFVAAFLALRAVARRYSVAAHPLAVVCVAVLLLAVSKAAIMLPQPAARGPLRSASAPPPVGASVILIMVDTLRADHLSCYGYAGNRTAAIDALATDGIRFARAYAQASWTRPSVATILTSLYPSSHQAVHKSDILPDAVLTLAEVMQGAGYRTIGLADNINVAPLFNFQQGFDEYEFLEPAFFFGATESAAQLTVYNQLRLVRERYLSHVKHVENYYQPAEVVTARALEWIAGNGDRPFFMFLHYMDPHDPYFAHPYNGEAFARVTAPNPDPALAERYREAYDGEIRYLDGELGRLLQELKSRGLYDRSLIVLTSDHGEEFYEHGGWWHGLTLYEEQIAVPLIVKPAGEAAAGIVNDGLVSSIDIAPTILAAVGIEIPEVMNGKALGLQSGAPAPRDHVFAEQDLEGNVLAAYRSEEWKLIEANPGNPRGLPVRQLFSVARDPREQHDLAAARAEQVTALATSLKALQSHALAVAVTASETAIDSATEERLRALGYVH